MQEGQGRGHLLLVSSRKSCSKVKVRSTYDEHSIKQNYNSEVIVTDVLVYFNTFKLRTAKQTVSSNNNNLSQQFARI